MVTTGSSDTRRFNKFFQIRWNEKLGNPEHPYLIRWTLIIFGFSIRLHHWLRSDDKRFFHDHSSNLLSIVLYGKYKNVTPYIDCKQPDFKINRITDGVAYTDNRVPHPVEGIFNSWRNVLCFWKSIWYSKATDKHYLDIPKEGAWTLLIEGWKYNKWGFYVYPKLHSKWKEDPFRYTGSKVVKVRPFKFFKKYGIIQEQEDYQ